MPLKKSIRSKKSLRLNALTRLKKYTRLTGRIGAGTIALVVIGLIAAAMLIGARQPSQPVDHASEVTQPERAANQTGARQAAMTAIAGRGAAQKFDANPEGANASAMESAAKGPAPKSAPVTITGCLERADETFRLKDTAGVDAPKSRSWKSGFLKKGSASIEVVDAANRLRLPDQVGRRVSVTGTLVDREMRVRSLQRVAASCTKSPRVRI
jgi:hypothetical protein